jgi:hypothetical protein
MKYILLIILLTASTFIHAVDATLSLGICDHDSDYCIEPAGRFTLNQNIYSKDGHTFSISVEHTSQIWKDGKADVFPGEDYGNNYLFLNYNVILWGD